MPLSRLDNFLKNVRGNIIYVDPNSLDATDSITNQGNSMARPFKTIQRALVEASRFSYQRGLDNDRFEKTTIMLAPGDHLIDNRPGWIPNASTFKLRDGSTSTDFSQFDAYTDFEITNVNNALYKLNSIYGGVIVPRGVSIVGQDLRKCKIRPLYVPNPENDDIEPSAIFRITGATYFNSFTIFDADPNSTNTFKDYTTNRFAPLYSHHKLTSFEYVDGTNNVSINDQFISNYSTDRTDLDMYYEKIGLAYGPSSGREILPDYPNSGVDIQAKIDEYRIVGPTSGSVGISSIKAGDGSTSTKTITVTLNSGLQGLNVDTKIQIDGVTDSAYNGTFIVTDVITQDGSGGTTSFKYDTSVVPTNALPSPAGSTATLSTDTVSSASPYIFNISMRSVYGMCGMHADGSKASGFRSMSVAQFTGISLQIDDNAFVKYNSTNGSYDDSSTIDNIHTDGLAQYKPSYRNYHIKASNNGFIQLVSIFAIGFAEQFVTESGGDFSITNSNSNFGQISLRSDGFREESFSQDDVGYITHIIPPKKINSSNSTLEYIAIDVESTVGVGSTSRLYLYNQKNADVKPPSVIQGYRIGAKEDDRLNVLIPRDSTLVPYSARIVMPNTQASSSQVTSVKVSKVGRNVSTGNSITSNTLTLSKNHNFINGETIRFFSDNTRLPDGLDNNRIYFAITNGLNPNQIKVAQTYNDALTGNSLSLNNLGGTISVESRVSDKNPGDIGHPIQYDSTIGQWYVTVGTASTDNTLYPTLVSLGTASLGKATPRTYITRTPDTRSSQDRIYKLRYVIPSGNGISTARVPKDSFILQESNDVIGASDAEVSIPYSPTPVSLSNVSELRNFNFIAEAKYSGGIAYYYTEQPHRLSIGSSVEINNITSTNYTVGTAQSGFNGTFRVSGITSSRGFYVDGVSSNPGTFTNDTSNRTTSLPTFKRKNLREDYFVYDIEQIKEYVTGEQDGIYYLTILNTSNTPSVAPYNSKQYSYSQPLKNLYPQYDRDNPVSDPKSAISYALPTNLGTVVINEPKNSITRETLDKFYDDYGIGVGVVNIISNATGTAHTIYTDRDHGLNRITAVSIASSGAGYGNGTGSVENLYNAILSNSLTGKSATARITVDASGGITAVKIMNGGSGYVVGETLNVVGTATTTGFSQGTVTVSAIYNNIHDTVRVSGVKSETYSNYNQLYRITGITRSDTINVVPVSPIPTINTSGIGSNVTSNAFVYVTGNTLDVASLVYDRVSGFATVTVNEAHGLRVNNAVRIGGATTDFYNGEFIVSNNVGLTTFTVNIGINTVTPTVSGTLRVHIPGPTAQDGSIGSYDEEFGGRNVDIYAGITTVISAPVTSTTTDQINIRNVTNFNFNIGDYLRIDDEIVRIKTTVTTNPVRVFRGVLGTRAETHGDESVIRRIHVAPVEFRRNSIIRASGHTFEYIGYGPGNYSTAFPDKQNRQLSLGQQLNAQSSNTNGGVTVYTGMNDTGDFFIGNKKIASNTGKEEVYDKPVQSVTGEDIINTAELSSNSGVDILEPLEVRASRSIKVDGGQNNNIISEFNGPVIFNEKLTSTSSNGIEANSLFLQGDAVISRNFTVGISTPTVAGTPGDVVYNAFPSKGGTIGWTYTLNKGWYPFGTISINQNTNEIVFDKVGIGTTSVGTCTFKVGSGSSMFCIDGDGVGIGTTANDKKLRVNGTIRANAYEGDGSGLTNLPTDTLWKQDSGNDDIYPLSGRRVGIGTTLPQGKYTLELGTAGTGTTDLYVANQSRFTSTATFDGNADVNGTLFVSDLNAVGGNINAGIITTTQLRVGTGRTVLSAVNGSGVGIGTASPRENLDVEGRARFKSYYEVTQPLTISSGIVNIDLSRGNSFELNATSTVTEFRLLNPVANSTFGFNLKINQGSTPRGVGINTFTNSIGNAIAVRWPGGLIPEVTGSGNAIDVYSFVSFDGGTTLYGGVAGQNFSNGVSGTTPFDGWSYDPVTKTVTIYDNLRVISDVNSTSDLLLKDNVKVIENALDKIAKIDGVDFTWKTTNKESMGVIAQNVETVLPNLVDESDIDGLKSVNYNGLIGLLIEAVKELNNKIDSN